MGIRVIGDNRNSTVRIQPSGGGIQVEGGEQPAVTFAPVGEQFGVDTTDHGQQPDVDGTVDPSSVTADSGSGGSSTAKRRGRKPGSRNKRTATASSSSQTSHSLNKLLYSVHLMGASLLKMPQLELSKEESENLTTAINEVTEYYDVSLGSPEQQAWINLAMVAGGIYIPKVFGGKQRGIQVVKPAQPNRVVSEPVPMPTWMQEGAK